MTNPRGHPDFSYGPLWGIPRKEQVHGFARQATPPGVGYDTRGFQMRIRSKVARSVFLLSFVFSLSALARPQLPAKLKQQAPANCEISGVVTDAATGRPIAHAQVMVFSQGSGIMGGIPPVVLIGSPCAHCELPGPLRYQTLTDARGRFSIHSMAAGWYRVGAVARGYAEQFHQVKKGGLGLNLFELQPGRRRDDISIRLPRQAVLTGRVIDEHGRPVFSAYVQLMQYGPPPAKQKKLFPVTATVTDDRGEYRLFGLLPGRYYIEARYQPGLDLSSLSPDDVAERFQRPRMAAGTFSPLFFYPGVTKLADAKPVEVTAGQVLSSLDISVRPFTATENVKLKPRYSPPRPRGDCEASGTVTNAVTGQPLQDAWVFLGSSTLGPPLLKTSTDAEGRFVVHAIPCNWAQPLLAWKHGFVRKIFSPTLAPPPGMRDPSRFHWRMNNLHFALAPAGVITGRITDRHGKPAACIHVGLIYDGDPSHPRRLGNASPQTVTDDRGRYRFFELAPGRYSVAAQIRYSLAVRTLTPVDSNSRSPLFGYRSPYIYYPHALTLAGAKTIRVAPGQEVKGIDFSVEPVVTHSISGVVKGPALQTVGHGLRVVLMPARSPYGLPFAVHGKPVDASGKFQIAGVADGSYVLWATAFVRDRWYAAWTRITVTHANITGVVLDPHPGWDITGHLRVESQPQGNFRYEISTQQQDDPLWPQTARSQDLPAGGAFELKGLFPGHYLVRVYVQRRTRLPFRYPRRFEVHPPPNWFLKSARFGTQNVRTGLLTVPMSKPAGALDLTVSWNGAQILGTVVNSAGKPASHVSVVLVPASKRRRARWLFRFAPLYEQNHFMLRGVPPGRYRLFAWNDVEYGEWFDPKFLERQWKKGADLDLSEGETKSVQLRAIDVGEGVAVLH